MTAEKDNERWKKQTLWHYEVAEDRDGLGFWVTRAPIQSWRFWALAPSAAYWLAAQLNIQMVGAAVTDGRGPQYRAFAKAFEAEKGFEEARSAVAESAAQELAGSFGKSGEVHWP